MTLSIALTLLIAVLLVGFLSNGVVLLAAFIPAGTPLGLVPLMIVLELNVGLDVCLDFILTFDMTTVAMILATTGYWDLVTLSLVWIRIV